MTSTLSENPFSEKHCKKIVRIGIGAYRRRRLFGRCSPLPKVPFQALQSHDDNLMVFFLVNWYKLWGLYEVYEFMVIPLNQLGGLKVLLVFALAQVMPVIGYHRYDLRRVRLCEIRQSNASWFTLRARNVNGITQRVTFVLICISIWNIGPSHDAI